ncbi:MAG: hypothetical protein Q7S98_00215 [Deltaproteobacteria bacterium]|nr:hypothetical protein [Deltaproteobacteria bacterium]
MLPVGCTVNDPVEIVVLEGLAVPVVTVVPLPEVLVIPEGFTVKPPVCVVVKTDPTDGVPEEVV